MAEKNILAYFKSPEEAEAVERKMQALRAVDTSVHRISRFPGEGVDHVMNPITGDFASLGNLTQDASFTNKSAAILAAADVTASGMSDGGQDAVVTGTNVLLTVVIDESNYDKALQVIREAGGIV